MAKKVDEVVVALSENDSSSGVVQLAMSHKPLLVSRRGDLYSVE